MIIIFSIFLMIFLHLMGLGAIIKSTRTQERNDAITGFICLGLSYMLAIYLGTLIK